VKALAKKIADGPQIAIRAVKHNLFAQHKEKLMQALEMEVQFQMKCFHSEDCREGIRAFMDKRAPKFAGR
jgi:2-(1,2-epoxy-1,2-dihydrophenyl)acetyl-CoA isomerase